MIEQLWSDIADFETNERKHEDNSLNSQARQSARMEAYVKLQEHYLNEKLREKRFVCLCGNRFEFWDLIEHQKTCEVINQ